MEGKGWKGRGRGVGCGAQGRSDGRYVAIYTPKKSVTVLFTCETLAHGLKLQ